MKIFDFSEIKEYKKLIEAVTHAIESTDEPFSLYLNEKALVGGGSAFPYSEKIVYNEYQNGLYLGSAERPYAFFVKMKDDTASELVVHEDAIAIAPLCCYNSKTLKEVIVDSDDVIILFKAFAESKFIERVVFNGSEKIVLSDGAFDSNYALSEIVFNPSATYDFGAVCFRYAKGVTKLDLPPKIERIGGSAFACCPIDKVYIPANVTDIANAFESTTQIYYEGDCSKLVVSHRPIYVETPDDYAFNFHRSAGSFSYTCVGEENIYAKGDNYHSFVTRDNYRK